MLCHSLPAMSSHRKTRVNKSVLVHRRTLPQYLDNHNITKYRQESIIERIHVPMFEPLMLELRHFVDCVRENRPSQVPGSDGLRAMQLAEAVADEVTCQAFRNSEAPVDQTSAAFSLPI